VIRTGVLAAASACLASVGFVTACLAGLGVSGALAAAATPARDSFSGSITAATGRFSGDHGAVAIVLAPSTGQGLRRLSLTVRGSGCRTPAHRCVALTGRLSGTLALGPLRVPDVGSSLTIRAAGAIKPLGQVSASGTVQGTGFIAHGRETLKLRLTTAGGAITIKADSAVVPGGTTP
jgi:hypothetical protein